MDNHINTAQQEGKVSTAFSKQSVSFDRIYETNTTTLWMRSRVRNEVLQNIHPNDRMLELNCGTGIDSIYFAQQGFNILATDNADGMLNMLRSKVQGLLLQDKITAKKCSFNNLGSLDEGQFDYVFSNFGGLNCTDDLGGVLDSVDKILKPGGCFTFVIMPKVCPWEILMLFKGYFKTAFRRFKAKGTIAHLEGEYFKCYYYNPRFIIDKLRGRYELCSLKGLCIAVPPPYIEHFQERHPKAFKWLENIENKLWNIPPFNRWCDHYIITMRKK